MDIVIIGLPERSGNGGSRSRAFYSDVVRVERGEGAAKENVFFKVRDLNGRSFKKKYRTSRKHRVRSSEP